MKKLSADVLMDEEYWIIRKFSAEYASKEKVLKAAVSEEYREVVKSIIARLKKEKITKEEADTLMEAKSFQIREFAVEYASKKKVLEAVASKNDYDNVVENIISRLKNEVITDEEENILLNARSWKIRNYAVGYASKEKLLKLAVSEEDENVAESIIARFPERKITKEEADTLIEAKSFRIREFAVEYASKEKLLEAAVSEKDYCVVRSIIERLEKEEITEEQANTLFGSEFHAIRKFAVGYASKEKLLKLAVSEGDENVAESIIARFPERKITKEEADTLMGAKSFRIREFAVGYASKEELLEAAVSEEDQYIAESIIARLKKEEITEEEANTLLDAYDWRIRNYAVEYASKEKVLEVAVSEENDNLAESIIKRLKEEKITEEEADTLLGAKHCIIRNYAVKYATKEKIIKLYIPEKYHNITVSIIERLEKEKITEKEANTLLEAENWIIRKFAVKYASKERVLKAAVPERWYYVAESIIERLEKERITKEEANTLLEAKVCIIRSYAVEYITKEKVLEVAMSEEYDDVAESITERLEKERITEGEANTLLEAKNWIIRKFAVEYASKKKVLGLAMSEEDKDIAESIIRRFIKDGITKKEAKELTKCNYRYIRDIARVIYKNF